MLTSQPHVDSPSLGLPSQAIPDCLKLTIKSNLHSLPSGVVGWMGKTRAAIGCTSSMLVVLMRHWALLQGADSVSPGKGPGTYIFHEVL